MTENAIEAVGLSKKFLMASERRTSLKERLVRGRAPEPKTFWALKDATFSVPKGSSLGLIGQNGSGKSTALKVLTGIYRPTSGQVSVNGSVSALLEVGAGFHPELDGPGEHPPERDDPRVHEPRDRPPDGPDHRVRRHRRPHRRADQALLERDVRPSGVRGRGDGAPGDPASSTRSSPWATRSSSASATTTSTSSGEPGRA